MTWIRWDCGASDGDVHHVIGRALRIDPWKAYGHFVAMCEGFGAHRKDGQMSEVDDGLLEQWARWTGKRGAWATAARARCQHADTGMLRGWDRNLALLEKQAKDRTKSRERQRELRANIAGDSAEDRVPTYERTDGRTTTAVPSANKSSSDHGAGAVHSHKGNNSPRGGTPQPIAGLIASALPPREP